MNFKPSFTLLAALAALAFSQGALALTPTQQLAVYASTSGVSPQAARGQAWFTATHGREWSCSSCHGSQPVRDGKHASTGKSIAALAPAANAQRFTDEARTEKWFRRNCNDVLGRECTATEKADVLAWLLTLQP